MDTDKVEIGFLVPVEAHLDRWSEMIRINGLLEAIGSLPARHLLVILDACRSGIALGSGVQKYRGASEYEQDLSSRRSRKVVTSARRDQDALDSGPVTGHSLFTGTLIEGLNWGKADLDGNGIVTGSELSLFVQQQVGQSTGSKQTPDFGEFYFDNRGELVISLRDDSFDAIKARAFAALQRGAMGVFHELVESATKAKPDRPETLYLNYRQAMHERNYETALEYVMRLRGMLLEKGTIPLTNDDLWELSIRIPYFQNLFLIPETDSFPTIEVFAGTQIESLDSIDIGKEGGDIDYYIPQGWLFRYRVTNKSDGPLHLYLVNVDTDGKVSFVSLWNDRSLLRDGLAPGEFVNTYPFATGTPGIDELSFYASNAMVPELLSPPSVGTRSLLMPFSEMASITRRTYYQIVIPKRLQLS